MLAIPALRAEAFELGGILRHGTAYKRIDFLGPITGSGRATHMAKEHVDRAMVQKAIVGSLESDKEAAL